MQEQIAARMAPRRPDEAVAILDPERNLWSFSTPGTSEWETAPAGAGAEVLQRVIQAPGAARFTIWRVVRQGESGRGITPMAQGGAGQPISSRIAVALRRMSALRTGHATRAGLIAHGSQKPAAEAPIRLRPSQPEVEAVPPSHGAPLLDGEPITERDAPTVAGEPLAMGGTQDAGVAAPAGAGVVGWLLVAAGGWWAWKKWGGKKSKKE